MATDIEIARAAPKRPMAEIAAKLGLGARDWLPYGHDKAKIAQEFIAGLAGRPMGKLILVTAINPTPAGEGKTRFVRGVAVHDCRQCLVQRPRAVELADQSRRGCIELRGEGQPVLEPERQELRVPAASSKTRVLRDDRVVGDA